MTTDTGTSAVADQVGYPRKRRRTRRRLLTAGTGVLATKGAGNFGAAEVAAAADVATGTFYNHFPTIDAFVDAVAHDLGRGVEIGRDALAEIEHDPARRVTIGVLQLLDMATTVPAAAAAFVNLAAVRPHFRARIRTLVDRAVRDGVDDGSFSVRPGEAATNAVLGTTLQTMRSLLLEETDAEEAAQIAPLILRLLGVNGDDIDAVVTHAGEVMASLPREPGVPERASD